MKKFLSLFAAVLFAGSMVAAEAVMAKGTTNSYDDNTVNGKESIKMGKSGAGGNMTITVAAGATSLSFYSAAWKNEGAEVTIEAPTGVTITPASYTVVATDELSGGGKSFTVANEENYKFTFALTGVTEAATFTLTSAKRCFVWGAEDDTEAPSLEGYFLVGTFNDWTPAPKYMLEPNEGAEGEYVLAFPFAKDDGLKVAKVQGGTVATWYPEGMGNEYKVDADHVGRKAIYFRPESKEDWKAFHEGGFFFIPANIDPKNCEEAAEAALSVLNNNDLYKDSAVYTIEGFVTEIAYAYDSTKHNMSFWMADIDNGGKLIQAYKCVIEKEEDAVKVGDKVKVTGCLTRYNETPEFAAGCTVEIVKDEPVREWTEILFDHAVVPADLPADAVFEFDGLKVAITDSEDKMSIDANEAYFGTEEVYEQYAFRLKTGGKSQDGNKKNFMNITVPADGELRIAVRTASSSDETRTLVLVQEGDTIYNQVVIDADAIEVAIDDSTKDKVFPYVTVPVKAGEIAVGYPVGAINFYEFGFRIPPVVESTWTVAGSSATLFGTTWDPANTANDMFKNDEGYYTWSKSGLELAAGDIAFKVCKDHAWAEAYPAQDYKLAIDSAGIYTITITFNLADTTINALAIKTGEAVVLPKVEIKGSWKDGKYDSSWNGGAAYEFTVAEDKKTASYILKLDEVHEYEFGFQFDGSWKANGAVITREANTTNLAEGSGNMKLNADQAGKYEFVYTFETQALVVNYPKPIQTYEVAEAIAAGLAENDEINVRGIITKMEFKGKNFAKYGSVNIYVKDATGAEGEFEFYNCYSLNADTFRTSTPAYDPESTAWAEFTEVADANGNAIHVGDTVIAFGKYKLYNTTYELNTGCYLIDIKHGTPAEADTIKLEFNNGMVLNMYYELYGSSDVLFTNIPVDEAGELVGDGDYLDLSIFPEDPNNVAGLYSSAEEYENFDLEYSYLLRINGTDTLEYEFVEAVAAIVIGETSREQGIAELAIEAKLATAEGLVFELAYTGLVAYDFIDEQGLEEIMTETNGKVLKIMHEGQVYILKDNKLYNLNGQSVR